MKEKKLVVDTIPEETCCICGQMGIPYKYSGKGAICSDCAIGPRILPIKAELKIHRNELCPCGSGKKFKKCCINQNNN